MNNPKRVLSEPNYRLAQKSVSQRALRCCSRKAWFPAQFCILSEQRTLNGTSLVVQRLRIRLLVQGTRVWSLVQEDPTCIRASKSVSQTTEPMCPKAHTLKHEKPPQWEAWPLQLERSPPPYSPQLKKALVQQRRLSSDKQNKNKENKQKQTNLGIHICAVLWHLVVSDSLWPCGP